MIIKNTNPLWRILDFQHIFTPIAIDKIFVNVGGGNKIDVLLVYVFGIRVGYINVSYR